jgi:serine/threonine-protein kinase
MPTRLGRYMVLGRLARGGMATVYVGRQVGAAGFERLVAIKCCHEHLRDNAAFAAMFLDEARLAARIRHPNVVATLDVSDGDPLYLIMEYVEGGSLSSLVRVAGRRGQRVPLPVTLRVMLDALEGLHAVHACVGSDGRPLGLIHCDVSPQNILVGVDGTSRITDFGVARAAAQVPDDGAVIKGKLAYMAPEQLSGGRVTQRVDLFAMGVVLWELLAGQSLFRGDCDAATIEAAMRRAVPPPSTVDPTLPPAVGEIVMRALDRDPENRYQTALEFLTALEELAGSAATTRAVGEYVRREVGEERLSLHWESASFPKAAIAEEGAELSLRSSVRSGLRAADGAPPAPLQDDLPTRMHEPSPDLVAASRSDELNAADHRGPPALDGYRARRLVVALSLILLGVAASLLLGASSKSSPSPSSPSSAASPSTPSSTP